MRYGLSSPPVLSREGGDAFVAWSGRSVVVVLCLLVCVALLWFACCVGLLVSLVAIDWLNLCVLGVENEIKLNDPIRCRACG